MRVKCLQTLQSVFGHKDLTISVPYIHALTPSVVALLRKYAVAEDESSEETVAKKDMDNANREKNGVHSYSSVAAVVDAADLPVVIEAEKALEVLVSVAREDKRKYSPVSWVWKTLLMVTADLLGLPLLALVVHILMSFIRDPQLTGEAQRQSTVPSARQLHDYALQRLNVLGPHYPSDFRSILTQLPEVKARLERAVRSQHQQTASAAAAAASAGARSGAKQGSAAGAAAQPTIKLTTDFSNFVRS